MKYSGYILILDEQARAYGLEDRIESYQTFNEALSIPDWKPKSNELALISLDGETISYICLMKFKHKISGMDKSSYSFTDFISIGIKFEDITKKTTSRLQSYFISSTVGFGKRISPKTWESILLTVKELRPKQKKQIEWLEQKRIELQNRRYFTQKVAQDEFTNDAGLLAVKMSGFKYLNKLKCTMKGNLQMPFMQGVKEIRVSEDSIINYDSSVFGDFTQIRQNVNSEALFTDGSYNLSVMNVNRTAIEHTLGVDLIYYHHFYKSYVMIQYKKMIENKDDFSYRPTDVTYKKEITNMIAQRELLQNSSLTIPKLNDYRLNNEIFYFKLCPETVSYDISTSMVKGMYLPLDYWESIMQSTEHKGPRNGIIINYENTKRYLNNTHFVDLYKDGWIGSRDIQTSAITKIIEDLLNKKHLIILAESKKCDSDVAYDDSDWTKL